VIPAAEEYARQRMAQDELNILERAMDAYASAVAREQTRHYRAALALTDRLRDPKHLAYLRASGFIQKFGIDVDDPGYMDTRRGTLKRIIARLETRLGTSAD
jgi:hypothetical protein